MATTTPTLIQAQELNNGGFLKSVPVSNAFNFSKLVPHIKSAEERFLVYSGLMSEEFYNDLISKVDNEVSNYNTAMGAIVKKYDGVGEDSYEELWVNYLRDLIGWAVLYEALPFIEISIGNAGVVSLEGNLQTSQGINGVKYLRDVIMEKINRSTDKVKRWLCENKEEFVLFDVDGELCEDCEDGEIGFGDTGGFILY